MDLASLDRQVETVESARRSERLYKTRNGDRLRHAAHHCTSPKRTTSQKWVRFMDAGRLAKSRSGSPIGLHQHGLGCCRRCGGGGGQWHLRRSLDRHAACVSQCLKQRTAMADMGIETGRAEHFLSAKSCIARRSGRRKETVRPNSEPELEPTPGFEPGIFSIPRMSSVVSGGREITSTTSLTDL